MANQQINQPERLRHSVLGVASFIIAILSFFGFADFFLQNWVGVFTSPFVYLGITAIFAVLAFILGLVDLSRTTYKKTFPKLGVFISGLILIATNCIATYFILWYLFYPG